MIARRALGVTLIIGAFVTALYWWSYFNAGDVMASHERWYRAFEDAFPFADGWILAVAQRVGGGFVRLSHDASPGDRVV